MEEAVVVDVVDERRLRRIELAKDLGQEVAEVGALEQGDGRIVRQVVDERRRRLRREVEHPMVAAPVVRDREP